jgi:opacity protein-like surface antigen
VWFAVAGGSGVVYHGQETVDSSAKLQGSNTPAQVKEGFSPASLVQLEPELGYQATRRLSLSILGRYQYAPMEGNTSRTAGDETEVLTSALAIFAQARLSFVTVGNLQTYASGGAGFGRAFLAVVDRDCQAGNCSLERSDTLHGGSFALSAGLGVFYHLGPRLGVFAELKEITSLPKFMALTELNLGLAVAMPLASVSGEPITVANGGRQP